jgi:hypothetical protein
MADFFDNFKIKKPYYLGFLFFCDANLIIKHENLKKFNGSTVFENYYYKIIDFNALK